MNGEFEIATLKIGEQTIGNVAFSPEHSEQKITIFNQNKYFAAQLKAGDVQLDSVPRLNQSVPVMGEIGTITCIDTSGPGEPEKLRYYAKTKHASYDARDTPEEAEADVRNSFAGNEIPYERHAELPKGWKPPLKGVRVGDVQRAIDELDSEPPSKPFTIGPGNSRAQAFDAMLAGHRIRQPLWAADTSWIVESNSTEILRVKGSTKEEWITSAIKVSNNAIAWSASDNWTVLPIIDHEPPTV